MNIYWEALVALHIVIGSFFIFVGSFGLIKLPDLMSRLHGPSKSTTLGLGGCLVASMIYFAVTEGRISVQEILITFFLFITAPVTAHLIAKAYLHTEPDLQSKLPPTGRPYGWSTFEAIDEDALAGTTAEQVVVVASSEGKQQGSSPTG
ncbi:Na+/H+ antiporter subunit G [Planctomycetaceae bacterium SH139]